MKEIRDPGIVQTRHPGSTLAVDLMKEIHYLRICPERSRSAMGSSTKMISGLFLIALAMAARFNSPPGR
jgi:hypothetical protein